MKKKLFRTYRRRSVTRRSGNKASGITTGGECIILNSEKVIMNDTTCTLTFQINNIQLENLFELDYGLIAFGGYIKSLLPITAHLILECQLSNGNIITKERLLDSELKPATWNGIGIHQEISFSISDIVESATLTLVINSEYSGNELSLISFDFGAVNYKDYLSKDFYKPFKQKTTMHIPHIYYLSTDKSLDEYLVDTEGVEGDYIYEGECVVLKGCNRCARYLPINILKEEDTLAFSLHCVKKAPCKHSLFSAYKIDNIDELDDKVLQQDFVHNEIVDSYVTTYYGHQLECRACKKYYVNFALNPLRNPQQFKEDGLRRRAIEVLVNYLLDRDLVHHEFEYRTKKQFTEFIWEKFNKRCFKCGKKLKIGEMHLDHTMPLAYLYRLDETASCLCAEHNSQKRDSFPVNYYSGEDLIRLSEITGLSLDVLNSTMPNMEVVELLIENIEWFFDEFLMEYDYQKERDGIRTADKIYASLTRVLKGTGIDLLSHYQMITKRNPRSINLQS